MTSTTAYVDDGGGVELDEERGSSYTSVRKQRTNGKASSVHDVFDPSITLQDRLPDESLLSTCHENQRSHQPLVHLSVNNVTYAPILRTNDASAALPSFLSRFFRKNRMQNERKVVLNKIATDIEPGKLTAWMGPSGSGKTSLISVVAGLCKPEDIRHGNILLNGKEGNMIKSYAGVVWQDDLLLSNLTVEETIFFAAKLKTPNHVPIHGEEVRSRVKEAIHDLRLEGIRHSIIGGDNRRGISGGERKRVAVAVELVARPSVLFLDEPTSGLDATTALSLVRTLKNLAVNNGQAVVSVIHQPRSSIFELFDSLLLLSKGRTVYNGNPEGARAFLETITPYVETHYGISDVDWIMDTIIQDELDGHHQLPDQWAKIEEGVAEDKSSRRNIFTQRLSSHEELKAGAVYHASFFTQLKLLTRRSMKQQRGEKISFVTFLVTLAYTLFTGIFWWRIPDDTNRIHERNSLLFFILIAQSNSIVVASITTFQRERALLARERAKKLYSVFPYFVAKTLSDMVNTVILPSIYGICIYWMTNLRPTAGAFFTFMVLFYLTILTSQSMGLLLSVVIRNIQVSLLLAPLISIFLFIMGGFYISYDNIHVWLRWATYISQARYGYTGMILNEYEGRSIPCADAVLVTFGSGTICPKPGEDVISSLSMDGEQVWFQIVILIFMQILFRAVSYVILLHRK